MEIFTLFYTLLFQSLFLVSFAESLGRKMVSRQRSGHFKHKPNALYKPRFLYRAETRQISLLRTVRFWFNFLFLHSWIFPFDEILLTIYRKEECFRCIFIMQKHVNVLQYRASYCTDQSDFNANCENLSPESELITVYRDNPISERCPLNGLYVLNKPNGDVINDDDRSYRSSNGHAEKCVDSKQQQSMIMECSDHSMLKLQFGKCTNMPSNRLVLFFFF